LDGETSNVLQMLLTASIDIPSFAIVYTFLYVQISPVRASRCLDRRKLC
jgi:hypothetical protein